jgi:2-polyprenyl-6-methoxyphenol hydroxylase-like FAD-dependent oxidoreductase
MSLTSNAATDGIDLSNTASGPDVLIVGAGPTGLTLAIELARRTIRFRLIDRQPEAPTTSRALGTQSRTVEVFRLMRIPQANLQPAARIHALQVKEHGRTLARITFPDAGGSGVPVVMNQADTERVLTERLLQLGGQVERGVAFESFLVDSEHVTSTLMTPAGAQTIVTRYVVGCDGANSTVRREAGIAFAGTTYDERFLLEDAELDWDIPHDAITIWFSDEAGIVGAIPLPQDRRWRLIVALPLAEDNVAVHDDPASISARAEEALYRGAGVSFRRLGDPFWESTFRIHRKQADHYRSGSVFLAGDAAHVHSPVGGQGMNTGIQDAFNLGWKLALAARGDAAPGLLDTYETERLPVARSVLRGTDLGTRLILSSNQAARTFREWFLPVAAALPPARRQLLATISELNVGYPKSPLSIAADVPRDSLRFLERAPSRLDPGQRVPDGTLHEPQTGDPVPLFDLIAGGWTMLLFPDRSGSPDVIAAQNAAAHQVRAAVGDTVQSFVVACSLPVGEIAATALIDVDGAITRRFGAPHGLVALVRPDGYLGYRGLPGQPLELASYLARIFSLRLPRLYSQDATP